MRALTLMFAALLPVASAAADDGALRDWIVLSAGREFTLRAPPGTKFRRLQGIDSFVGEFVHPRFAIRFDYGIFSNDLSGMNPPRYVREQITVDGRLAIVVSGKGEGDMTWGCADHMTAMYVPSVDGKGPLRLQIHGCTPDSDMVGAIGRVFRSIRFLRGNRP